MLPLTKINNVLYSADLSTVVKADDSIPSVKIEEGAKIIDTNAFLDSSIEFVDFPKSLKKIYDSAFFNSALRSLKLENEMILGEETFKFCYNLEEIVLNAKVIPYQCFANSSSEKQANIKLINTEFIGSLAFAYMQIKNIDFPDTLTTIEKAAFANCTFNERTLKLPQNVQTIHIDAFKNTNLTDIYIPDSIKYISNLQDMNINIHMSKKTFENLNLSSNNNICLPTIEELLEEYTFKEINSKNLINSIVRE